MALKRAVGSDKRSLESCLFRRSILGHSLGAFRHGMFGQLSRKKETDRSLDFPGGNGGPLVVVSKTGRFSSNSFENVVDERIHDGHGFGGDPSVRMNLLQHLVDVDCVGFLPLALLLLISLRNSLLSLPGLLGCFTADFRRHGETLLE